MQYGLDELIQTDLEDTERHLLQINGQTLRLKAAHNPRRTDMSRISDGLHMIPPPLLHLVFC